MKRGIPFFLITLGIIFLLQNYGVMEDAFWKLWPVFIIMLGLGMIAEALAK